MSKHQNSFGLASTQKGPNWRIWETCGTAGSLQIRRRLVFCDLIVIQLTSMFQDGKMPQPVLYNFPPINALTQVDRKYFAVVHKEAEWPDMSEVEDETAKETSKDEKSLEYDGLTETGREFINIVGTADELSNYYKSSPRFLNVKKPLHHFLYHQVALQRPNKSVVGVYIN